MTAWKYRLGGIAESLDSYIGGTTLEEIGERVAARLDTIPRDLLDEHAQRLAGAK